MNKILDTLNNPDGLERLFRKEKNLFLESFDHAFKLHPDSETLKVWNARLSYSNTFNSRKILKDVYLILIASIIALCLVQVPTFTHIDGEFFYPRFVPIIVIGSLIFYFYPLINTLKARLFVLLFYFSTIALMLLLPNNQDADSIIMAQLYMPFVLLSLLGFSFMGNCWKNHLSRLAYINYLGELLIYTSLILLGGIILTFITLGLFNLIGLSEDIYLKYVVVWGLITAPLVATYLYDVILSRESKLAGIISNVFSPLFLITLIFYLIAMAVEGKNPYADRDSLILFNGLLLVVWAITVFSISGNNRNSDSNALTNTVNFSLLCVTLILNGAALSAIAFRLSEFGITANRISVIGSNLLIFIHLVLILKAYFTKFWLHKTNSDIQKTITSYLPVYSCWSLLITVFLPLIF